MSRFPAHAVVVLGTLVLLQPVAGQSPDNSALPIPAFPGAEGFGAYTEGGRGGAVFLVTTLADYDRGEEPIEGSLRAAVEQAGRRNIVFRVAGYIDLKRPLEIEEPYLTVAGQTAPGEGVTLRRYGVDVKAPQVILRHVRIRPGDVEGVEQDALNIRAPDVIVDHCSVSWGTDETLSIIGAAHNVTVQWCLISESLHNSVHAKGGHGYGTLLTATGDVSIHHTAYALHYSRNPRPKSLRLDFRNNLIYGYGDEAGYNYDDFTRMNYVGNYIHPLAHSDDETCAFSLGGLNSSFYFADNHIAGTWEGTGGWDVVCFDDIDPALAEAAVREHVPVPAAFVTTDAPQEARQRILQDAGATLPARDAVDRRLVRLIEEEGGAIIDSQEDVGGWPPLASAAPPPDSDEDGLPDAWESRYGFDPSDPADQAADADGDGYTNLEEFFNGTNPREAYAWTPPPTFSPPSGTVFADSVLSVEITAPDPDALLFYTLDGSEPDAHTRRYDEPLQIRTRAHVRAAAIVEGTETMPAFAEYEELTWLQPLALSYHDTAPGLNYAFYEADDWDEGADIASLTPTSSETRPGLDLSIDATAGAQGIVVDGLLQVPEDGVYGFLLVDEYRSELRIGEHLVSRGRPADSPPAQVALRAGLHRIHLRSLTEAPRTHTTLRWQPEGGALEAIPDTLFLHVESRKGQ